MPILNIYTCKEALQRLDDYVDRELSPRETEMVKRHLRLCRECSRKFAFEADVIREVRAKLQRIAAPPDLLARVSQALSETPPVEEPAPPPPHRLGDSAK